MEFGIKPADRFIWNLSELVDFLIKYQRQSITINTGTEGCCARTVGLYHWLDKFEFSNVTIITSNPLEKHDKYHVEHFLPWKFLKIKRPISVQHHVWNQQKIFGALYGRPLWHRLGIAAHLLTNHSTVSQVVCMADPNNQDQKELFELVDLWKHHPESLVKFSQIQHQLPCTHHDVDQYTPGATLTDGYVQQTERIYKNFLIDVVAETFTSGDCFFLTEKTARPMLLKKPMIVMGSKNHLEYLHQMGFRTFADFWDEDYDGYADADRYVKILDLINKLSSKSMEELEAMYWDMQYTLDHNYNLLLTQGYNKKITAL